MAKGPLVTHEVELLIGKVYYKHPTWKAKEVKEWVNYLLKQNDASTPDNWPGLSRVQKVLATIRSPENKPDPQGEPWSMATLEQHLNLISNDAIPAVLKLWAYRLKNRQTLTIREAKWAARLWGVKSDIEELSGWAREYARAERIYKSIGRPFNTDGLDPRLMGFAVQFSGDAYEATVPLFQTEEEVAEAKTMMQLQPKRSAAEVIAGAEATLELCREQEAKGMVVKLPLPGRTDTHKRKGGKK